jgi:hypothetical protein
MGLYRAAGAMRLGALVGGDAGGRLAQEAIDWMSARGVRRADRMAAMLLPGF